MGIGVLLAALINLGGSGHYVHWGFIQLSVANLVVILAMIVVFILAILLPFPKRRGHDR
jgi:ABC-type proline/glycine betaine transport system permease subunit